MRQVSCSLTLAFVVWVGCPNQVWAATASFYGRKDYAPRCVADSGQLTAVADTNGDGIPDIICGSQGQVLFGNGDGTFRVGPLSFPYGGGSGVATADLNGDGKIDLVYSGASITGNPPYSIAVSLGNGDGTFQPLVFYATDSTNNQSTIALGDFNNDGILDAATVTATGVWLFTGRGKGIFNPGTLIPVSQTGGLFFPLSATDVNGDGNLDLIVGTVTGFVVLIGNGNGTFTHGATGTERFYGIATGMTVADLNGDGKPDIVLVSELYTYVYVYLNKGDGTFYSPKSVSLPGNFNVAVGDVNGDHIPDLVSDGVYVALGKGDGTFRPQTYFPVSSQPQSGAVAVTLADLRNSGHLDIVTVNGSGFGLSVLLNNGRGKFLEPISTPVTGGGAGCPATADFNRDGKPDIAVAVNQGVAILLGTGAASKPFAQSSVIPISMPACPVTGDVNGDGIMDLLVGSYSSASSNAGSVLVFLGRGDGSFSPAVAGPSVTLGALAVGDFNGDGKLDYAMTSNLLALGNGDGTFQTPAPFVPQILPPTMANGFFGIATADVNGDGKADVFLMDVFGNYVYVLLSNSSGLFSQSVLNTSATNACYSPNGAMLADVNGDRKLDLVLACGDPSTPIYLNDGRGNFTYNSKLYSSLATFATPVVSDFNGDGIVDLAVVTNFEVQVYLGQGSLTYASPFYLGVGTGTSGVLVMNAHGQNPLSGTPDIVVTDVSGRVITLLNLTK